MAQFLIVLLSVLLLLLPAAAQDEQAGEFIPERCPMPIPGAAVVDCGYLIVPERHENPEGPTIELAVAILRASDPNPRPDPVLYLEGGPGGSALWGLDGWIDYQITRERDLILLDQRGTGYSWPGLFCDAYEYEYDTTEADFTIFETDCAEYLRADGIDLGAYNSAQSAQDVAMLVRALGYDQVNLYGISYGTRLAMTIMRDVPEIARAVVLDSPYPPQIDGYESQAINGFNAIDALLTACADDPSCDAAFPDLGARFYAWVESGETAGMDLGDGPEDLGGYDVVSYLFDVLYDSAAIPTVPLALDQLIGGDGYLFGDLVSGAYSDIPAEQDRYDAFYELADDLAMESEGLDDYDEFLDLFNALDDEGLVEMYAAALETADDADYSEMVRLHLGLASTSEAEAYLDALDNGAFNRVFDNIVNSVALGWVDVSDADGVFNSVTCVEELPFNDLQATELSTLRLPDTLRESLMSGVYEQIDSCEIWDVEVAGAIENEVVRSAIPTLVLGGQFDPITPPNFAEAAMEGLTSGQMVIVPGAGHSVIDAGECPASLGVAFLNEPSAPVDTSCVSAIKVNWATE